MVTSREEYYTKMYDTIINYNDRNDAPFSNEKTQQAIHEVIVEEEFYAHNITFDDHNVNADTFSQTTNTQRDNPNTILTSEKLDKLDALSETLNKLTINDAGYYELDSANADDATGDTASDPKTVTHISGGNKRKVTGASKGYLKQNLLSNWTLLIITTTMDPRIDYRVATCRGNPHTILMTLENKVITDMACSSVQVFRTPRRIIRTSGEGNTRGFTEIGYVPKSRVIFKKNR